MATMMSFSLIFSKSKSNFSPISFPTPGMVTWNLYSLNAPIPHK